MAWTYRIVRRRTTDGITFGIHEAYDDGNIEQPHSVTTDPVPVSGDTVEELAATLERMKAALTKPVLELDAF